MTAEQLASLVGRYGVACRVRGEEVLIKTCLSCGNDRWNQELNAAKGVYHCWACNAGGRLDSLLGEQFGVFDRIPVNLERSRRPLDSAEVAGVDFRPVIESNAAWSYLQRRGVTLSEAIRYRIGVCLDERDRVWFGRVVFPLRDYWLQGKLGIVGRLLPGLVGPKWRVSMTARQVAGIRNRESRVHCLVEGMFDGVAVARWGWNVAIAQGKPRPQELLLWAALVPLDDAIVLLFDGDAQDYARRVYYEVAQVHSRLRLLQLESAVDPGDLLLQQDEPKFVSEIDDWMDRSLGRVPA